MRWFKPHENLISKPVNLLKILLLELGVTWFKPYENLIYFQASQFTQNLVTLIIRFRGNMVQA